MEIHRFAKRIGVVVCFSAAAMAVSGSAMAAEGDDDVYQLPPVPTIIVQPPPVPAPEVELPRTGTSNLQTSLTLGVSAAALGGGLLLVARRRREPAVVVG